MSVRSPLAPVAFLTLAVCLIAVPESASGLLLLTPALVLVLPLLFSVYPGEKSVVRLASWFCQASPAGRFAHRLHPALRAVILLGFGRLLRRQRRSRTPSLSLN